MDRPSTEATQRLNEMFARIMAEQFPELSRPAPEPRYRYFSHRQWMFCWTTERMDDGKFAAFIYKPVGKGAQSGHAREWELVKELRFAQRKTAKARALQWRETAARRTAGR